MTTRDLTKFLPLLALLLSGTAVTAVPPGPDEARIETGDVDRFYRLYDAEGPRLEPTRIQSAYLDQASPGLVRFAQMRNVTAERIAAAIAENPELYAEARACATNLPAVRLRLAAAISRLRELLPDARLPTVTILVGRGRPVGVGTADAVMIGLEALCAWTVPEPDSEDRFVHVIAHEYAHAQQPDEEAGGTVLKAALTEGVAELVAELTTGSVAYRHLDRYARGREFEIETEFLRDVDTPATGSAWVYNGLGTADRPGDLGYWVGYRIAKAYYLRASDKRAALRRLLALDDPAALLAESGWRPGADLPEG